VSISLSLSFSSIWSSISSRILPSYLNLLFPSWRLSSSEAHFFQFQRTEPSLNYSVLIKKYQHIITSPTELYYMYLSSNLKILVLLSGVPEQSCVLGSEAVSREKFPTFRNIVVPSSSARTSREICPAWGHDARGLNCFRWYQKHFLVRCNSTYANGRFGETSNFHLLA